jgi:hypothetical protein
MRTVKPWPTLSWSTLSRTTWMLGPHCGKRSGDLVHGDVQLGCELARKLSWVGARAISWADCLHSCLQLISRHTELGSEILAKRPSHMTAGASFAATTSRATWANFVERSFNLLDWQIEACRNLGRKLNAIRARSSSGLCSLNSGLHRIS